MDKKIKERDDLHYELSGEETGQIKRFLSPEARDFIINNKKQAKEKMSLLDILLLTDPLFRNAYVDAMNRVDDIEKAVDHTLSKIDDRILLAHQEYESYKATAYTTTNGQKIYEDRDKNLYFEDGTQLTKDEKSIIPEHIKHASWEEHRKHQDYIINLLDQKKKITHFKEHDIDDVRIKLKDATNRDEIDDIMDDFEKSIPQEIQASLTDLEHNQTQNMGTMLSEDFQIAKTRTEIPDLDNIDITSDITPQNTLSIMTQKM